MVEPLRIVSLLPSATEIVCAVGARANLVGVSHECDYPGGVEEFPVLTRPRRELPATSGDIDRSVRQTLEDALAWARIGTVDAPTKLGAEADSLTLFRSLGADPVEVVGEVDEDLIRRLRALGYSE